MKREDVYKLIEEHRAEQDKLWPRDLTENPNRAQYKYFAPHIMILEEKIGRLRALWYGSSKEDLHKEMVKIATIAVRALEEVE